METMWWIITHFGLGQLGPQLVLLLVVGELGVDTVDLVTQLVDGSFELILLFICLGNELVVHVHGVLALGPGCLESLVGAAGASDDGQVALADLLLDLAGLLGLLVTVGVHSLQLISILCKIIAEETYIAALLLALLGNRLLNLHVLNVVARLDVEDTVQVQAGLELANHKVIVGISLDTLNGETTNPRVDLAGQHVGLGVTSLEVERLLTVESEDLGRGHHVAAAEDSKAGVLIRNIGRLLPGEVDGVVHDVVDGEVTNTEDRGKGGAAESAATGNSLVLVEGEGQVLAEELADGVFDGGHTSAATNHLDEVNVLDLELGLSKSLLEGNGDSVQEGLDHLLELLTLQHSTDIGVLHQRLDAHRSLRVG